MYHLQVSSVADIATADGKRLSPEILVCERITHRSHRSTKWEWHNQLKHMDQQKQDWKLAMQRYSLANGSKRKLMLRKPLGRWTTQPTQDWSTYIQLEGENLWVLDKNTKQWKVFTNKSQGLHTQRSRNSIPTQTAA